MMFMGNPDGSLMKMPLLQQFSKYRAIKAGFQLGVPTRSQHTTALPDFRLLSVITVNVVQLII